MGNSTGGVTRSGMLLHNLVDAFRESSCLNEKTLLFGSFIFRNLHNNRLCANSTRTLTLWFLPVLVFERIKMITLRSVTARISFRFLGDRSSSWRRWQAYMTCTAKLIMHLFRRRKTYEIPKARSCGQRVHPLAGSYSCPAGIRFMRPV